MGYDINAQGKHELICLTLLYVCIPYNHNTKSTLEATVTTDRGFTAYCISKSVTVWDVYSLFSAILIFFSTSLPLVALHNGSVCMYVCPHCV